MKTLFLVGEGKTDIGTAGQHSVLPEEAREGVVQVLVRRVLDASESELAFKTRRVRNFPREPGKFKGPRLDGDARNAYRAYQMARLDADGLVMVRDSDNTGDERLEQMEAGVTNARQRSGRQIPHACGLAIHTIEAWVLGALACRDQPVPALPRGKNIEGLWGNRNDPASHHPRSLCRRALDDLRMNNDLTSKVAWSRIVTWPGWSAPVRVASAGLPGPCGTRSQTSGRTEMVWSGPAMPAIGHRPRAHSALSSSWGAGSSGLRSIHVVSMG
jgi:hypothetical protein